MINFNTNELNKLKKIAKNNRKLIFEMITKKGGGHYGGAFVNCRSSHLSLL